MPVSIKYSHRVRSTQKQSSNDSRLVPSVVHSEWHVPLFVRYIDAILWTIRFRMHLEWSHLSLTPREILFAPSSLADSSQYAHFDRNRRCLTPNKSDRLKFVDVIRRQPNHSFHRVSSDQYNDRCCRIWRMSRFAIVRTKNRKKNY